MSHGSGHSVSEIYKGVITDVINQVREAFLDENVDVDVLTQLKKEWEDKVNASGCVDMDTRHPMHTQHVAPPAMRQGVPGIPPRMNIPVAGNPMGRIQTGAPMMPNHPQHHGGHMDAPAQPRPIQMQYVQQPGVSQLQPSQMSAVFPQGVGGAVRMVHPMPTQHAQPFMNMIQNQQGMMFIQSSNGQHIPVTMGPNGVLQQRMGIVQQQQPGGSHGSHQQVHQLDGGSNRAEDTTSDTPLPSLDEQSSSSEVARETKPTRKEAESVLRNMLRVMQLDGGGAGMSDSSSEDEEEENDPLRRIADRIGGDGQIEDGETIVEEDPLNSEDDQTDDEDLDTLFDAENVVMCQFEKVHRARSKWKFILKDGIMHIDNRDYCFQRCNGEAEW